LSLLLDNHLTVYHPVVVHLAGETVGSQLLIDIEDYQVPSSPLYLATPPEIMGRRRNQKSVLVPRAHQLRRLQNSTLNASALARLRLPPPPVNRSIDQYGLYPPVPDEEMEQNLWDNCNEEEGDLLDDAIEQLQWVTLEEEQPLPQINPQIESAQERHQLLARECNWLALIEQMHAQYMILKLHTHNWARYNTYELFPIQCVCPPHLMYLRKVDMVDIYGVFYFLCLLHYTQQTHRFIYSSLNRPKTRQNCILPLHA
jgi:hypothetical protein